MAADLSAFLIWAILSLADMDRSVLTWMLYNTPTVFDEWIVWWHGGFQKAGLNSGDSYARSVRLDWLKSNRPRTLVDFARDSDMSESHHTYDHFKRLDSLQLLEFYNYFGKEDFEKLCLPVVQRSKEVDDERYEEGQRRFILRHGCGIDPDSGLPINAEKRQRIE